MKNPTTNVPAAVAALPASYLALMGEFPLRPIKSVPEYDRAARIIHRLALREGKLVGSKGAASELLSGKRKEPSKAQIAKLCARFKVDASAFLLPARASADAA